MSDRHREDDRDAALVRRIAESYRPAELSPAARVAFRARVDARIRRRRTVQRWAAGSATAAAALALVLLRGSAPEPSAPSANANAASDAALLALALPADSEEESLPADYQAIEDLFLEGEGV
jgi:hypothetical protein